MITTILFDIGGTLVRQNPSGTAVRDLVAVPAPGARRTLQALARHHRLGAVTDTSVMRSDDVRAALAGTGLAELLEVIVTSVDVGATKPDPRGLLEAMRVLGAAPDEVLFVGDTDADGAAARAAGTAFARTDATRDPADAIRVALTARSDAHWAARALVAPADDAAVAAARARHDRLTKPPGSLGRLEDLAAQLAGISGEPIAPLPSPAAVGVFAGDHGVVAEGVTPWPQAVTAQMVATFVAGGAAINVLARHAGASVTVVDVGVATDLAHLPDGPPLVRRRVRDGTANLAAGPAMSTDEAHRARVVGAEVATELVACGARALVTGEMGIGNTTAAAAVIATLTRTAPAKVTGRGTGVDDDALQRKVDVVERAVERVAGATDALTVLAEVGGLEIAALAGFITAGASHRIPVVVDGVIANAALLAAVTDCPGILPYVIAGHRSTEPGATAVLDHLGLQAVLDLDLRLGEGSGACLALPVIEAAARITREMATFDDAGVSDEAPGSSVPR